MSDVDTIVALATPVGVSAIAIIRLSGSRAFAIARACFRPRRQSERVRASVLEHGTVSDAECGEYVDDALVAHFPSPKSYTGEDVVEFHVHGGAGVVSACLKLILRHGARLAHPGEFTKRAFINGRLDLSQAEAVADLINAETERASKAAAQRLSRGAGRELHLFRQELLDNLVAIEAHVDYPDEVSEPDLAALARCVRDQLARVDAHLTGAACARVLRDGIDCVIAGPPNAGKSSLLNALLQAERAIVSAVPGTTRDIIEDRVAVDGVVLRLRDTAGLRETVDAIEAEGVARARRAVNEAELVLAVIDASKPLQNDERAALAQTATSARIIVGNKLDLGDGGLEELRRVHAPDGEPRSAGTLVSGSVLWPQTIAHVRNAIAQMGWGGTLDADRASVANTRQIEALTRARESLMHAQTTIESGLPIDLVSVDLRDAVGAYGEVTGDTVTAEVLDGIFSRFCVGK